MPLVGVEHKHKIIFCNFLLLHLWDLQKLVALVVEGHDMLHLVRSQLAIEIVRFCSSM